MECEVQERLLAALESRGVKHAIFGAVALNLHGIARFREDPMVTVVTPETLYRMKKDTARLQDRADA